jgi:hypothetical protein
MYVWKKKKEIIQWNGYNVVRYSVRNGYMRYVIRSIWRLLNCRQLLIPICVLSVGRYKLEEFMCRLLIVYLYLMRHNFSLSHLTWIFRFITQLFLSRCVSWWWNKRHLKVDMIMMHIKKLKVIFNWLLVMH